MTCCTHPVRIPYDPAHCGNCGHLINTHDPTHLPTYDTAEAVMWGWYVLRGETRDGFGANTRTTGEVQTHLEQCCVDVEASTPPVATTLDEFVDTFSPTQTIDVTVGYITCECGRVEDQPWTLEGGITFGDALHEILTEQ